MGLFTEQININTYQLPAILSFVVYVYLFISIVVMIIIYVIRSIKTYSMQENLIQKPKKVSSNAAYAFDRTKPIHFKLFQLDNANTYYTYNIHIHIQIYEWMRLKNYPLKKNDKMKLKNRKLIKANEKERRIHKREI